MKSLVVLLANSISDYALEPIADYGVSACASALRYAVQVPDYAQLVIVADPCRCTALQTLCNEQLPEHNPDAVGIIPFEGNTVKSLFEAISVPAKSADTVFFVWADAPFTDGKGTEELYALYRKYKADYSFADGYPEGLFPHIIASSLLPVLLQLPYTAEVPLNRSFLFDLIKKDINAYDLETLIAPEDVRALRLRFYTGDKEGWLLCNRFAGITAQNYGAYIARNRHALRLLPAYYGIEITGFQPLHSLYRPRLFPEVFTPECCMDPARFSLLVKRAAAFSEHAVISLSLYGEPLLHPHIKEMIAEVLVYPGLSVLIETNGLSGTAGVYQEIAEIAERAAPRTNGHLPLYWIVFIDAVSSRMYAAVHSLDESEANVSLKKAVTAAEQLSTLFPHAVWAQITRMQENESEIEPFYRLWEKQHACPLIQKYDPLCGVLPDRRVADISPLERHPCWHLKRDMSICTDGTVVLCKEDIGRQCVLGNAFTDPLETVWRNGDTYYRTQLDCSYTGLCRNCDEYYTYNF